jgi:hypothetical protein
MTDTAERIFNALDGDIRDRQGLGGEWGLIDGKTKEELHLTWIAIINKELEGDQHQ